MKVECNSYLNMWIIIVQYYTELLIGLVQLVKYFKLIKQGNWEILMIFWELFEFPRRKSELGRPTTDCLGLRP